MMIPDHTDIKTWFSSLLIDFPNDNIPILTDNKNWKSVGNHIIQGGIFATNSCPATDTYDEWLAWAKDFYFCMANSL